jgi:hypothetical protein
LGGYSRPEHELVLLKIDVIDTVLDNLHIIIHLVFTAASKGRFYYWHFMQRKNMLKHIKLLGQGHIEDKWIVWNLKQV